MLKKLNIYAKNLYVLKPKIIVTMKFLILTSIFILTSFAQSGIFKSKYENGNIKEELAIVESIYDGTCYWYYENGLLQTSINYNKGKVHGWVRNYYKSGLLKEEFYVSNGVRDGLYKLYYDNGSLHKVERYENGALIKKQEFGNDPEYQAPPEAYRAGIRIPPKNEEEAICMVDVCPAPIGGMYTIYENLIYPEEAKMYGLEGKVIVTAFIDDKGNVESTELIKDIGLGCGKAAENAIKKTKFVPGKMGNDFVKSDLVLYVKFALDPKFKEQIKNATIKFITKKDQNKDSVAAIVQQIKKDGIVKPAQQTKKDSISTIQLSCDADICPQPEQGLSEFYNSIEIPERARRNKASGVIELHAVIDEFGFVRDTKLIKGIGYGCDDAVEFALLSIKFKPAQKAGKAVQSNIKLLVPVINK